MPKCGPQKSGLWVLAPRRLETVLAPEVSTWPTADSPTITGSDPPHGEREPFVGRGTHRQRAFAEAGHSGFSTNPTKVSVSSPARPTDGQLAVVDVPAPACPWHHCLRFLARRDDHVPTALRVRGDQAPRPTSDPLQRHHPSKRRKDATTAARDHRVGEAIRLLVTRSRQPLSPAPRRIGEQTQNQGTEVAAAKPDGQCGLRTRHRYDSPRVSGLVDPAIGPQVASRVFAVPCLSWTRYLRTTGELPSAKCPLARPL